MKTANRADGRVKRPSFLASSISKEALLGSRDYDGRLPEFSTSLNIPRQGQLVEGCACRKSCARGWLVNKVAASSSLVLLEAPCVVSRRRGWSLVD